jgi:chromosome segregation ATPase
MDSRTRNKNQKGDPAQDLPSDSGAEMKLPKVEDEVLGAIAGVEQQLSALRKAHADHREAMAQLAEKRRELAEESERIRAIGRQVEERGEEIEGREEELTAREVELAEMRQEIETREGDVTQRASRIEQRESKIAQQAEQLERREAEVESKAESVEIEAKTVASQREQIEMTARELAERAGTLETRESELAALEAQAAEKLARESAAEALLEEAQQQLRQLEGRLKGRELELGDRSKALEEMAQRAGVLEAELAQTTEKLSAALRQAEEKLSRERKVTEGLRAQIEVAEEEARNASASVQRVVELEALLEEARVEIERVRGESGDFAAQAGLIEELNASLIGERERCAALEGEAAGLREALESAEARLEGAVDGEALRAAVGEAESLRVQLDELIASADEEITQARGQAEASAARAAEVEAALRVAEERAAEARSDAEAARAEADRVREAASGAHEQVEAARAEVETLRSESERIVAAKAEAEARAAGLEARAVEMSEAVSKLKSRLDEAEGALLEAERSRDEALAGMESAGANSEEADRLRDALTAAIDRVTEAERSAESVRSALEAAQADLEAKSVAFEKMEAGALSLECESRELKERVQELEIELEVSNAKPRPQMDEFVKVRRKRMSKQRRLLREQSAKISRATGALRDRLDQCDAVLQKRAELAQAYQAIVDMRQKNAKREVRGGVLFGVVGIMAVLGMLGASSWYLAGVVSPGQYEASVVIAGEAGAKERLSESNAAAWQDYIVELAVDPRFLEAAADRMKRRGIADLGTAGALGRETKSQLTIETPAPDEVRLAWRGDGADRTRRILDTYAVALSSVANQSRGRRSDGAMTRIEVEASASNEPLDRDRVEMAGMMFGGSSAFMLLLGGVLLKKLSAAKARFERDVRVEPILDDSQWSSPLDS